MSYEKHDCGLEVTYCTKCMSELEIGQVGLCDSCQHHKNKQVWSKANRMKISIKRTAHGGQNYCAYKGETLFATINGDKPNRANNRVAHWSLCYLTGRVEWFDTLSEAKDYALKG